MGCSPSANKQGIIRCCRQTDELATIECCGSIKTTPCNQTTEIKPVLEDTNQALKKVTVALENTTKAVESKTQALQRTTQVLGETTQAVQANTTALSGRSQVRVQPIQPISSCQSSAGGCKTEHNKYQQIVDGVDVETIIHADVNFQPTEINTSTICTSTNRHTQHRKPLNDGWKEKYFAHGELSNVLTDIDSKTHACMNAFTSKKIDEYLIQINQISIEADRQIQDRIASLSSKEQKNMKALIQQRNASIEQIVGCNERRIKDYEKYYRDLIEEYIRKLEIEMTTRLDELYQELDAKKRRTFDKSQDAIRTLTLKVEDAKKEAMNHIYQKAREKIDDVLEHIRNLVKDETSLGYEQLTTVNLQIYSNVGVNKGDQGCDNIPNRNRFIDDIDKAKSHHRQIKRTVYLGSNYNTTLPRSLH